MCRAQALAGVVIYGGAGVDAVETFDIESDIYGGVGNDTYLYGAGLGGSSSYVFGGAGNDTVVGLGDVHLYGGAGQDIIQSLNSLIAPETHLYGVHNPNLTDTYSPSGTTPERGGQNLVDDGATDTLIGGGSVDNFYVGNNDKVVFAAGFSKDIFHFYVDNIPAHAVRAYDDAHDLSVFANAVVLGDDTNTGFTFKAAMVFEEVVSETYTDYLGATASLAGARMKIYLENDLTATPVFEVTILGIDYQTIAILMAGTSGTKVNFVESSAGGNQELPLSHKDIANVGLEIAGTVLDDALDGTIDDDTIYGLMGDDVLHGGDGADILYGGLRDDELFGDAGDDHLEGGIGADDLNGGAGNDTLLGGNGHDTLNGGDGDDVLRGGSGDDVLIGGLGADTYDGGFGIDTADYSGAVGAVDINLESGVVSGEALGDTYIGIENISGSSFNDMLTGDEFNNIINGGAGDDVIDGGDRFNTLNGDAGADRFIGGVGIDVIDGGLGVDTVDYSGATSRVDLSLATGGTVGDAAGDTFTSIEIVIGSDFDDNIEGTAGNDTLNGGDGVDELLGGAGDDILNGGDGNDDLTGGEGADVMNGGEGRDRLFYNFATSGVTVNLFNAAFNTGEAAGDTYSSIESLTGSNFDDSLTSGNDDNILVGLNGNDVLIGAGGRDSLFGGNGDDRLLGGTGNDILYGQGGIDTFVIQVGAGTDRIFTYEAGIDVIEMIGGPASFADLAITQEGANTQIIHVNGVILLMGITAGTVTAGDFTFINPLPAPTGVDVTTTLTTGDDNFTGDENNDIVNGLAGNDVIRGGIGDDTLNGGDGNDQLFGGLGADILDGGAGIDRVLYSSASTGVTINAVNSALNTGEAAGDTYISIENFYGSAYNDTIITGSDNNYLVGLDGNDVLSGGGGNDTLFGGNHDDRLLGGTGNDVLYGQGGNDTYIIQANAGNDRIFGFEGGQDIIEYRDGPADFVALTITQVGADVEIVSVNGTLTLKTFTATDLDASDFTFLNPAAAENSTKKPVVSEDISDTPEIVQDTIAAFLTDIPDVNVQTAYRGIDGFFDILIPNDDGYAELF